MGKKVLFSEHKLHQSMDSPSCITSRAIIEISCIAQWLLAKVRAQRVVTLALPATLRTLYRGLEQSGFFSEGGVYTQLDCAEAAGSEIPGQLDCAEAAGLRRFAIFLALWGWLEVKFWRLDCSLTVLRRRASG